MMSRLLAAAVAAGFFLAVAPAPAIAGAWAEYVHVQANYLPPDVAFPRMQTEGTVVQEWDPDAGEWVDVRPATPPDAGDPRRRTVSESGAADAIEEPPAQVTYPVRERLGSGTELQRSPTVSIAGAAEFVSGQTVKYALEYGGKPCSEFSQTLTRYRWAFDYDGRGWRGRKPTLLGMRGQCQQSVRVPDFHLDGRDVATITITASAAMRNDSSTLQLEPVARTVEVHRYKEESWCIRNPGKCTFAVSLTGAALTFGVYKATRPGL